MTNYNKIPLVAGSCVTVSGNIKDIIEFAKECAPDKKGTDGLK